MALIIPVISRATQGANSIATATWTALTEANTTGVEVSLTDWSDRSIQISGTFGGATVSIQGSNDGINWDTMRDPNGNLLSAANMNAAKIAQLLELSLYLRPLIVGGAGVSIKVVLAGRTVNPMAWS